MPLGHIGINVSDLDAARTDYDHPGSYATFWLGHEGAYLEAVCHRDEAG